jgi:hypothetical protein
MNQDFAERKQIESALIEYQRTPGKYPLLLRRPEILFSSIKEVLQLASGRLPDAAVPPSLAVQRAAGIFVRNALLYTAADHYALLGLQRSAEASAIKERYRQMMRLTHPDFATSPAAGGNWPADAAARINQAYEVLASQAQRRSYDEQLNAELAPAPNRASGPHWSAHAKAAQCAAAPDPRRLLKRMAGAFGILAGLALLASLLARGPDRESLVQRAVPQPSPLAILAQTEATAPVVAGVQQMTSVEATALMESLPALRDAFAPRAEPPQLAVLMQSAPGPALRLPVAVEAPLPQAGPGSASRRTALAPMPALTGRIIGVSNESAVPTPTPAQVATPAMPAAPVAPMPVQAPVSNPSVATASAAAVMTPLAAPSKNIVPAVTMVEAHNLLSALLQQMESGSGDRLLGALDRNARNASGAQALARQYNGLVEGARSVKVTNVLLKADPREDRLLVRGQVLLEVGDDSAMRGKEIALEAEFAKRNGAVVMTRLAPAQATGTTAR